MLQAGHMHSVAVYNLRLDISREVCMLGALTLQSSLTRTSGSSDFGICTDESIW